MLLKANIPQEFQDYDNIIEFWNPVRQVNSLMISLYLFS